MTQLERFVADGTEKPDELAKAAAMLDEGFMAEARAETVKQEREEVYVALQYAASFHLFGRGLERLLCRTHAQAEREVEIR